MEELRPSRSRVDLRSEPVLGRSASETSSTGAQREKKEGGWRILRWIESSLLTQALTYINRQCECFLAHDGGLPLVGKGPEIGMSKYRFGTLSNCFLSSSGFVGGRYGHRRTRISRGALFIGIEAVDEQRTNRTKEL